MATNESLLYQAAVCGDKAAALRLLQADTDINCSDNAGNTPLHAAAASGRGDMIRLLLDQGAGINARNGLGNTPLCHAIDEHGRTAVDYPLESIRLLLAADADPNAGSNTGEHLFRRNQGYRYSGLKSEKSEECITLLRLLLDHGLDPNQQDPTGRTLLHHACALCNPLLDEALALLLDHGADSNASAAMHGNCTPVHILLGNVHMTNDSLNAVIEADADFKRADYQGRTPLNMGSDPDIRNQDGLTPLMSALGFGSAVSAKAATRLLHANADPNAAIEQVRSLYHYDAKKQKNRDTKVARMSEQARRALLAQMLKSGLDPHLTDAVGNTLLHTLCRHNAASGDIQLLLDASADPNRQNRRGDTPLLALVKLSEPLNKKMIRQLLEHGADPTIRNAAGDTACAILKKRALFNTLPKAITATLSVDDDAAHVMTQSGTLPSNATATPAPA